MPEQGRDGAPWAKKKPTVALFPLDRQSDETLRDSFSQFSIEAVAAHDTTVLCEKKLEGCVVSLTSPMAEDIVAQARQSAWQKRIVVYAVGPAAGISGLAKYGINVHMESPVSRQAALRAIRSTRLLLLNELRRYVRLPLATPVALEHGSRHFTATSSEISGGGMSLQCVDPCPPPNITVSASFAVPGSAQIDIASVVCWSDQENGQFGLRFNPTAEGRLAVQAWIESYLGLD